MLRKLKNETSKTKVLFSELNDLFVESYNTAIEQLSSEDREHLEKILDEGTDDTLEKITDSISNLYLSDINNSSSINYRSDKKYRAGFERRLLNTYEPYLVELYGLITLCTEAVQHHRAYIYHEKLSKNQRTDRQYGVIVRLHARALRICNEIDALVRSGYGAGALARWRALHEIVTTISFLIKNPDATDLFLEHNKVLSYKAMLDYNLHASGPHIKPFVKREIATAKRIYSNAINKYTRDFDHEYGWLKVYSGRKLNNFRELEAQFGQSQLRPYYRYASYGIHTNAKALLSGEEHDAFDNQGILLIGASDGGMEEVAQLTPISICYATTVILTGVHPTVGSLIMAKTVMLKQEHLQHVFEEIELPDVQESLKND